MTTTLSNHEASASFSLRFNAHNIELTLGDGANNDGWTVELFVKPCAVSIICCVNILSTCVCDCVDTIQTCHVLWPLQGGVYSSHMSSRCVCRVTQLY